MNLLSVVKLPLAAVALVSAPFFAAHAGSAYYHANCSFNGLDPYQDGDCYVHVVKCLNGAPAAPEISNYFEDASVATSRGCVDYMRVVCDNRILYKGGYTAGTEGPGIGIIRGLVSSKYPVPPALRYTIPTSVPSTVEAQLEAGDLERDGQCRITRAGNTMNGSITPASLFDLSYDKKHQQDDTDQDDPSKDDPEQDKTDQDNPDQDKPDQDKDYQDKSNNGETDQDKVDQDDPGKDDPEQDKDTPDQDDPVKDDPEQDDKDAAPLAEGKE